MKRQSSLAEPRQVAPAIRGHDIAPRSDPHRRSEQTYQQRPELGDWDGPVYGELGVLATDEERAQCHVCGRWYLALGRQVVLAHHLSCDEYRAIFCLRKAHGLVGPGGMREVCRQQAERNLKRHWEHAGEIIKGLPPEQRPG